VNGIPNTYVSILRGSSEDEFGDATDTETVLASGILASLHKLDERTSSLASDRLQQLGMYAVRMKYGTDVQISDRIKDEKTGDVYVVADVVSDPSVARRVDVRCRVRKLESA